MRREETPSGASRCIGTIFLVLVAGACRTYPVEQGGPKAVPAAAPRPWPQAFQASAVLIAEEITVEGPLDLLDHVVVTHDPWNVDIEEKTLPEGLRQVATVKAGRAVPVRAQLDRLELVATRRLVLLARPGGVPVVVRGLGDAFWSTSDERASDRGAVLELRSDRSPGRPSGGGGGAPAGSAGRGAR